MNLSRNAILPWLWEERIRIVKYLISGFSAVFVDAGIYYSATRWFNAAPTRANIVSVAAGSIFAFTINKLWSFQQRGNTIAQSRRFIALAIFNYGFQQVGFYVATKTLHLHDLLAKCILIGIMVSWNFLIYKYWVYAVEHK